MKLSYTQRWSLTLPVFLIVIACRFYYVEKYAVALPYWDQWDGEGDLLLRAWIENRLKLLDLWQPHNEHRIFPTRILSLLIFLVTGEWNNLTEARVNILLASAIPALLMWLFFRDTSSTKIRLFIIPVILAQFALPFSFENLLIGFQSQFYFLILFTLFALILAAYKHENVYAITAILFLCVLSVFTMGSGLLTPIAVCCVYIIHLYEKPDYRSRNILISITLIVIAIGGYLLIPQIPANQIYRVRNIFEIINATGYILSWPFMSTQWAALILWLPATLMIPVLGIPKKMTRIDLVMTGCFVWSFLQALAIGFGRGQELTEVASRYTELFTLGLISNAWFACRAIEHLKQYHLRWVALIFFVMLFFGHAARIGADMHDIRRNHRLSVIQTRNVCMYLKTSDKKFLQTKKWEIPFPDPVRLQSLLDNPTIREILPKPMSNYIRKQKNGAK
ncbi:hypothetical protein [Dyadobacter arcticus]|uniref:Glycosyltransferase RgtA/B/C/D-like domain-containing protein n=1 Tax=Dyadobacter arcticus TaxID=1078754 RepID=A0ABX0UMG3_9BACT|nr:hypothetical protein [Dyadobacter arcticus]NIJ54146.1 hypothetical protein [Dyadobacter arcticus]